MAIKVGNKEVANITVGSTPVKSVYKGSTLVWPSESWHTIFDTETTWYGSWTSSAQVFASTTNESRKFRIRYKGVGQVSIYQHGSRSSNTEYTDIIEISETGSVGVLSSEYYNFVTRDDSEVTIKYNTTNKQFTVEKIKEGSISDASLTIYSIEQWY